MATETQTTCSSDCGCKDICELRAARGLLRFCDRAQCDGPTVESPIRINGQGGIRVVRRHKVAS